MTAITAQTEGTYMRSSCTSAKEKDILLSSRAGSHESGDLAAKYRYAQQCSDPEEKRRWLKAAAEAGYIPAMCDYGLECDDHLERKHWLREAAYEGYVPAIYRYALDQFPR